MLLTEFNQEAFARVIREEGIEEGTTRLNQLNSYLIAEKRFDDLARATKDKQYQSQLYKEYGLQFAVYFPLSLTMFLPLEKTSAK